MSWKKKLKKIAKYTSGGGNILITNEENKEKEKKAGEAAKIEGGLNERRAQLGQLESEFADASNILRNKYTGDAQRMGTYSGSDQFKSGLDSEVRAGVGGFREANMARQNALRAELGLGAGEYNSATDPDAVANPPAITALPGQAPPNMEATTAKDPVTLPEDQEVDPLTGKPRLKALNSVLSEQGV